MKVLFIASYADLLGANLSMLQLMKLLKQQGLDVCALLPVRGNICKEFDEENIPYVVSPYKLALTLTDDIAQKIKGAFKAVVNPMYYTIAYRKVLKQWGKPDVIHSNTSVIHVGEWFNMLCTYRAKLSAEGTKK